MTAAIDANKPKEFGFNMNPPSLTRPSPKVVLHAQASSKTKPPMAKKITNGTEAARMLVNVRCLSKEKTKITNAIVVIYIPYCKRPKLYPYFKNPTKDGIEIIII